jgi:hypothetical protein
VLTIVRKSLSSASPPTRAQIRWLSAFWLLMLALQIWDSRDAHGPSGIAEFLSTLLGLTGIGLVFLAHTLHLAMQETAQRAGSPGDRDAVQQVLLALPALGFAAGVCLGAAAILMVLRGILGAEWLLAIAGFVVYTSMLALAARTVMGSVRTLFLHAVRHAKLAGELRETASAAQLSALLARMNPHFLFNALNTVAALVRSDPVAAERVTEDLSVVLRTTLDRSASGLSTVADEIDHVRAYLGVEQVRWGDRLQVEWDVDPAVIGRAIPPLVLQPLVENALHHGIGGRSDGGTIRIQIRREGDRPVLIVEDDGDGFPPIVCERTGLGNLRDRLTTMYGTDASLEIDRPVSGARVVVKLPLESDCDAHPHR